jgi:hypothetical protein
MSKYSLAARIGLLGALGLTGLYIAEETVQAGPFNCCGQDGTCNIVNHNTSCTTNDNCASIGSMFPFCCAQACNS